MPFLPAFMSCFLLRFFPFDAVLFHISLPRLLLGRLLSSHTGNCYRGGGAAETFTNAEICNRFGRLAGCRPYVCFAGPYAPPHAQPVAPQQLATDSGVVGGADWGGLPLPPPGGVGAGWNTRSARKMVLAFIYAHIIYAGW